jgi:hypothetical protein
LEGRAFNLQHTKAICDAFDGAWASLRKSNDPLTAESLADEARTVLAKRIIVMAESGMQDRAKLQADALDFLANNPPNT